MRPAAWLMTLAILPTSRCHQDSVFPAYQRHELVSDAQLVGTWRLDDDVQWTITANPDSSYGLMVTNRPDNTEGYQQDTIPTSWTVHLARHAGLLLADLQPVHDVEGDDQLLPLHRYAVVVELDSLLVYVSLDDEWFAEYVRAHPRKLQHLEVDGRVLVTASPASLEAFLVRHWGERGAWTPPEWVEREESANDE
jgi:hypothetical protein